MGSALTLLATAPDVTLTDWLAGQNMNVPGGEEDRFFSQLVKSRRRFNNYYAQSLFFFGGGGGLGRSASSPANLARHTQKKHRPSGGCRRYHIVYCLGFFSMSRSAQRCRHLRLGCHGKVGGSNGAGDVQDLSRSSCWSMAA